ncbi:MAG: iron-sulfur cluster assembly accessory protein [Acidobacteriota bacterium]|nr:iron-sulfur cluster assembly accessory protein [Acidobacteriota bacterium]
MITLTEAAQLELSRILSQEGQGKTGIRLGVKGGGCSGFTYVMDFADGPRENDKVFNAERTPIYIDPKSLMMVQGIEIDYTTDMFNRSFKFSNPNATASCGCGTSFAV